MPEAATTPVETTEEPTGPEPEPTEEGVTAASVITFSSLDAGAPAAMTTGRLVEDNGCVVIMSDGGGPTVPLFREESGPRWQDGELTFDGTTYPAGTTLIFGGGELAVEEAQIPEACTGLPTWHTFLVTEAPAQ